MKPKVVTPKFPCRALRVKRATQETDAYLSRVLKNLDFGVGRYDACRELTAPQWHEVLVERAVVKMRIGIANAALTAESLPIEEFRQNSEALDDTNVVVTEWFRRIFQKPCEACFAELCGLPPNASMSQTREFENSGVTDITLADALQIVESFSHLAEFELSPPGSNGALCFTAGGRGPAWRWGQDHRSSSERWDHPLLSRPLGKLASGKVAVKLDLQRTDDELTRNFAALLAALRAATRPPRTPRSRKVEKDSGELHLDATELTRWKELRALACIDIDLLARFVGVPRLSHAAMGAKLFPESGPTVNKGDPAAEKVREYVRPAAARMQRAAFLVGRTAIVPRSG